MSKEAFRRNAHQVIDRIIDYWDRVEQHPVRCPLEPGDVRRRLPPSAPQVGEPFEDILRDVDDVVMAGLTHWQSPNFFAYFPSNASEPSVLGELLCAGLGVQGMLWATSPACTELETHVMDWLADALGLPEGFKSAGEGGGIIQDYASSSALCALLAARERATGGASNLAGCDPTLVAYCSSQTHSSVEKAVRIAGLGSDHLRVVEVDEALAMRADRLAAQIEADRRAGLSPCFVCATVGTTSTLAVDPVPQIGPVCRREGLWLHVDAAMAGSAAVCPEFRHLHDGLEHADSYCFNPHKWLLVNHGCSCFWVRDRRALTGALGILPEYLANKATSSGAVIDYRDWQIPLGRRFSALKLWFVLRHYGVEGLQAHVRRHVALAELFERLVEGSDVFELVSPRCLNLVCFRHVGGDEAGERTLEEVNASGAIYLTHTRVDGRYVLRMCVGQARTQEHHVRGAFERLEAAARR